MSDTRHPHPATRMPAPAKNGIKQTVWRVIRRIGFHLVALFAGAIIGETADRTFADAVDIFPLDTSLPTVSVEIAARVYLGMLLLFPFERDRVASASGIIAALACLFTDCDALGLLFGGLIAFSIATVSRRKASIGSLLVLILIGLLTADVPMTLASAPAWYYVLLGTLTVSGILCHNAFTHWIEHILKKPAAPPPVEPAIEAKPPASELPASAYSFDAQPHLSALKGIQKLKKNLPADFIPLIDAISLKTRAILECMQNDSMDVARGTQFLSRYLPMIHTSLERFISLSSLGSTSPELSQVQQRSLQAFTKMSHAFSDMHQRLLENDMDDLMAELNVMDKLIESDGHAMPKH